MHHQTRSEQRKAEEQTSWLFRNLAHTPPGDTNFKNALEAASLPLLECVLHTLPDANNKTHRQVIERRIRKLQKQEWG
jgi:hypothetical protein